LVVVCLVLVVVCLVLALLGLGVLLLLLLLLVVVGSSMGSMTRGSMGMIRVGMDLVGGGGRRCRVRRRV
jgi:hypothetical protein